MQTSVQKPQSIRFGSGVLKINNVNVGLLDSAKLDILWNMIEIKAHNGLLPIRKKPDSVKFSAELYEIDLAILSSIDTHGVLTAIGATTPTTVTDEIMLATGNIINKSNVYWLANQSSPALTFTVTNVKANGSTLTLGTDYVVVKDQGRVGIQYVGAIVTALTNNFTCTYTYNTADAKRFVISDIAKLISYYEVKFENTDGNGKKFTITLPKGYQSNGTSLAFVSDDATDETMKVPFEFTAYPDTLNQLVVIDDEQSPN